MITAANPIPIVVQQHAEESINLCGVRMVLVIAPHVKLRHLRRLDDRLAAHLDGLSVAGEFGARLCEAALVNPGVGEAFAATARAIEGMSLTGLDRVLTLAEAVPESHPGVLLAFNWASAQSLRGITRALLDSQSAFRRRTGIVACNSHLIDPGSALAVALVDTDTPLRGQALRAAGECGRRDLLGACVIALADEDAASRFWAARSTALLGEGGKAIDILKGVVMQPGPARARALSFVLKLIDVAQARELLKALAQDAPNIRLLIQGAGNSGDSHYVPWLIKQMEDLKLTRLAGEAFSFITGLDLAYLDLDRKPPANIEFGPNDDPNDDNVSMDEDDGLPWPDPVKIHAWWDDNKQHFRPGVRYFMGQPPTVEYCKKVLREGYQRQRIAAAEYLCLLQPGTKLFPTSAPAWRQERWLKQMG